MSLPSKISDKAIVFSGACVLTIRCTRQMDVGGDPRRTRIYSFPLSFEGVGSEAAAQISKEMHELGMKAMDKVKAWEWRAVKP